MKFGDRLKKLRRRAGLSQEQLAERAGLDRRSIQNWEQGHRFPRWPTPLKLAEALGVRLEVLMRGVDE